MKSKKIVFIGESSVGKTSLIFKIVDNIFDNNSQPTILMDIKTTKVTINDEPVKLEIWDCAGQEEFAIKNANLFKGADLVVFVFDLNDIDSFTKLQNWRKNVLEYLDLNKFNSLLIGNKSDITQNIIKKEDIDEFCKVNDITYCQTSAADNDKEFIINCLVNVLKGDIVNRKTTNNIELNDKYESDRISIKSNDVKGKKSGKCC